MDDYLKGKQQLNLWSSQLNPPEPWNGVRATFTDSILLETHRCHMVNRVPNRADQSEMIFNNTFNEDFTSWILSFDICQ